MNSLARQTIGHLVNDQKINIEDIFDRFFDSRFIMNHPRDYMMSEANYPPYNIIQDGDDRIIEYALAGFTSDEIKVSYDGHKLTIEAEKLQDEFPGEEEKVFITKGIAFRRFMKTWTVGADFEVQEPVLKDGILSIRFKSVKEPPQLLTIKSE